MGTSEIGRRGGGAQGTSAPQEKKAVSETASVLKVFGDLMNR